VGGNHLPLASPKSERLKSKAAHASNYVSGFIIVVVIAATHQAACAVQGLLNSAS
jgi:hypothetical protein